MVKQIFFEVPEFTMASASDAACDSLLRGQVRALVGFVTSNGSNKVFGIRGVNGLGLTVSVLNKKVVAMNLFQRSLLLLKVLVLLTVSASTAWASSAPTNAGAGVAATEPFGSATHGVYLLAAEKSGDDSGSGGDDDGGADGGGDDSGDDGDEGDSQT